MFVRKLPEDIQLEIKNAQTSEPVNLQQLVGELGIKVSLADLPPKISGELNFSNDHKSWQILINKSDNLERRRFTVAHEIAHFLLHLSPGNRTTGNRTSRVTDNIFYRSDLSDEKEKEANLLAAEILMPRPLINKLMAQGLSRDDVAKKLRVSQTALSIRLGFPT